MVCADAVPVRYAVNAVLKNQLLRQHALRPRFARKVGIRFRWNFAALRIDSAAAGDVDLNDQHRAAGVIKTAQLEYSFDAFFVVELFEIAGGVGVQRHADNAFRGAALVDAVNRAAHRHGAAVPVGIDRCAQADDVGKVGGGSGCPRFTLEEVQLPHRPLAEKEQRLRVDPAVVQIDRLLPRQIIAQYHVAPSSLK